MSIIDCSIESTSKRERLIRIIQSRSVDVWENEGGAVDEHVPDARPEGDACVHPRAPVRDLFGWSYAPATK